jgi:hypothetical protein
MRELAAQGKSAEKITEELDISESPELKKSPAEFAAGAGNTQQRSGTVL